MVYLCLRMITAKALINHVFTPNKAINNNFRCMPKKMKCEMVNKEWNNHINLYWNSKQQIESKSWAGLRYSWTLVWLKLWITSPTCVCPSSCVCSFRKWCHDGRMEHCGKCHCRVHTEQSLLGQQEAGGGVIRRGGRVCWGYQNSLQERNRIFYFSWVQSRSLGVLLQTQTAAEEAK